MLAISLRIKTTLLFIGLSTNAMAQTKTVPQLGKASLKEVIRAMTLEEKVNLVMGTGMNFPGLPDNMRGPVVGETQNKVPGAAGTTFAIPRLGIPSIVLADGPAGLRIQPKRAGDTKTYYCTAFPIATLLSSTWDTALIATVGKAMGNEVKEYGVDIFLAPALNIHRNPLGGRNFEYYSEDPLLAGKMTKAMVRGIESQGVGTSIKHFAANNNEVNRNFINVKVSERALREIYLRAFEMTIRETQPWTVMSSYNKINGTYTSESFPLLTTILREEWGYKGIVMTDWFGGADPIAQMKAGNELLMPGTAIQQKALVEAVKNKTLEEVVLDKNVERILQLILKTPTYKKYAFSNSPDLKAHAMVARSAAAEGMVLLQNNGGALPVATSIKKVAVFGNASYDMVTGGTGSGDVNEAYTVSLIEGLRNKGFQIDQSFQQRYETTIATEKAKRPKQANPFLLPPPIEETIVSTSDIQQLADQSEVAIITIGRNSGEFADRTLEGDFYLTMREKDLLRNVTQVFHTQGKKVIVVLNIGGVIETASWKDSVDAILLAWQPGQEAGNAITDVLSGTINPSGKIVTTFPVKYEEVSSAKNFPGAAQDPKEVVYEEGIYVGYRYADKFKVAPSYPFGFGLSYTTFSYSPVTLSASTLKDQLTATVTITNTGKVAGKEVAQLYITAPAAQLDKPAQELKGFAKTRLLQPGQSQQLVFTIHVNDLASFDPAASAWMADAGLYTVKVGASSRDSRQEASFTVPSTITTQKVNKVLLPQEPINEIRTATR
jgi:beta-glucosidase